LERIMAKARNRRPEVLTLEDRSVPASLGGTIYADVNGNSVRDAGEVGLSGVTVQFDYSADGKVDATVVSDANGKYQADGAPAGTHTVNVLPPSSTRAVGPTSRLIAANSADVLGIDIGLRPNGKISGSVFADVNGNSARDVGETALAGTPITLDLNGDGAIEFATTSAADGSYSFQNVADGTHKVAVTAPLNYQSITPNPQSVTVVAGVEQGGVNVALKPVTGLSGRVYMNEVSPANPGVAGLTVNADFFNDGTTDATTATDANGAYYFANVPNGTHTVAVLGPTGSVFTNPDGNNVVTTVVSNGIQGGVDFALQLPGTVRASGFFLDSNRNGVRDGGERTVPPGSVQVQIGSTNKTLSVVPTVNPDGSFTVSGLPNGAHTLIVSPPGGYASSSQRIPFSVVDGGSATISGIAVVQAQSNTLVIGNGSIPGAVVYNFAAGAGNTVVPSAGKASPIAGKTAARVLAADFNGDGTDDLITAAGPGESGTVRVYDGVSGAELIAGGALVFESSFTGGVNLAAGDFNFDGKADIVVTADTGGGTRVRILNGSQFQTGADPSQAKFLADFLGIDDPNFRGGARAAVGDINGDGTLDLVIAAGTGGGPRVAVYDGASIRAGNLPTHLVADFFAFESTLRNGATVAVGDVNGDGKADLVAGAGPGGAPRVVIFSGSGILNNEGAAATRIADFFVDGNTTGRNGTRITVKDLDKDGKADLVASNGAKATMFTSKSLLAYYLSPNGQPTPPASADLTPYGNAADTGVFLG